jgi:hypothetical protein
MAFIQVMTYRTEHREEMDALVERWMEDTEDVRRARKRLVLKHRDEANHYMEIIFFDSYEDAMHNSTLPATQELSSAFGPLTVDGFQYANFDVVADER